MSKNITSILLDMLQASEKIQKYVKGKDFSAFETDDMCHSAVIRHLEIIGEAANRIPKEFHQSNPQIPWKNMIGMRNILIHAYEDVLMEEVWNAATNSIPELIAHLKRLLDDK